MLDPLPTAVARSMIGKGAAEAPFAAQTAVGRAQGHWYLGSYLGFAELRRVAMPHRRSAARIGALLFLVLAAAACGDGESSDVSTGPTVVVTTTTTAATTTSPESTSTTPGSPTTAPRPTSPPATAPPATSPPVTSPPATDPPVTAPGRTAALGSAFFIMIGETVTIASEGLSVTFSNVGPDSRCPPTVQCIQAGSASIGLTLAKAGSAPAVLVLFTSEGPATAQYGPYTVELFRLTFGTPASANIRVN